MIYGEDNPALLRFYRGVAKKRLACRVVYKKYRSGFGEAALALGSKRQIRGRGETRSREYYRLIDKIRLELMGHGLTLREATGFFQEAKW